MPANHAPGSPLPGTPADAPEVPEANPPEPATREELEAQVAELEALLKKERTAHAEEVQSLNHQIETWKAKFKSADAEVGRYQVALAEAIAEEDTQKRLRIRDALAS